MKRRRVIVTRRAREDLRNIREWIRKAGAPRSADAFVNRLRDRLVAFDVASERGSVRDSPIPGLRVVGLEGRTSVAFVVEDEKVVILRVFYGQDWTAHIEDLR